MRRLSLHASALNNDEYDLYTASLKELADDDQVPQHGSGQGTDGDDEYFEKITLGVREVRAWIRGRYSSVSTATIDTILRYFSLNLGHSDTLSGGQFFAALRLVVHAQDGKDVDRSLAFVQAYPTSGNSSSRPSSPPKRHIDLPRPPMPSRRNLTEPQVHSKPLHDHPQPPLHPSQRPDLAKGQPTPVQSHATHNPFLPRPKSNPRSEDGSISSSVKGPPLPPRKQPPPPLPTPTTHPIMPYPRPVTYRAADRSVSPHKFTINAAPLPISVSTSQQTLSSTLVATPPHPPPKPTTHVTSALIKQSLQASKAAQTMKYAEKQLEKERVMQVLKSSNNNAGYSGPAAPNVPFHRARSRSPAKVVYAATSSSMSSSSSDEQRGSIPRWRNHHHHQQPSPPMSTSSLEQVALATSNSIQTQNISYSPSPFRTPIEAPILPNTDYSHSPFSSPGRANIDLPSGPPPTHPDRKVPSHLPYHAPPTFSNQNTPQRPKDLESFEAVYGPASSPATVSTFGNTAPFSPQSPTQRVFRSKSMHQPSPPLPPLPPPVRRKRPESVQVLKSGEILFGSDQPTVDVFTTEEGDRTPPRPPPLHHIHQRNLSRHTSASSSATTPTHRRSSLSLSSAPQQNEHAHASPLNMSNIQRTIATLQPKLEQLQPKLDKARYKAEAGLSRRGFVSGRHRSGVEGEEEEGLMGGTSSSSHVARGRVRGAWGSRDWEDRSDRSKDGSPHSRGSLFDDLVVDGDVGTSSEGRRLGSDDDDDEGVDEGSGQEMWRGRGGARRPVEKDNLKWPAGEGWKPL